MIGTFSPAKYAGRAGKLTSFILNRTIAHPVDRVFATFSDVEKFPSIVRLVRSAELLERGVSAMPDTQTARFALKIGYGLISTRFVGRALVNAVDHAVVVAQESGPFATFKSKVQFQAMAPNLTRMVVSSDWTFPQTGIGGLIGSLVEEKGEKLQRKLIACFVHHLDRMSAPAAA